MRYGSHLALAAMLAACGQSNQPAVGGSGDHQSPSEPSLAAPEVATDGAPQPIGLSLADLGYQISDSAQPCADFHGYVCGRLKAPAKATRWSRLAARRVELESELAGQLAADQGPAGALYRHCIDDQARTAAGVAPLAPLLEAARGVGKSADLPAALATLHRHGVWAGFSFTVAPDFADGRSNILHLDRAELALGDRDYYLGAKDATDHGQDFAAIRKRYQSAIADAMTAAGASTSDARRTAGDVLTIETALARMARSRYERRAPAMLYQRLTVKELGKLAGQLDWKAYLKALDAKPDGISTTNRRYLDQLSSTVRRISAARWARYLEWQVIWTFADQLGGDIAGARRTIDGLVGRQPIERPRERRCAVAVADALPELTGALLAANHLPDERRPQLTQLVDAMIEAHAQEIAAADWLTADTRSKAATKLQGVATSLPATAATYPSPAGGYLTGLLAARAHRTARQLSWTVGGGEAVAIDALAPGPRYHWLGNRLLVPPGMLGLDHLTADRPLAAAAGALATTVGHELAHAVDARGADWNARGGRQRWWTESDLNGYVADSKRLIAAAGPAVDGRAVVAEARADHAGLSAGFRAYRALAAADAGRFQLAGATLDQLFFIAAADALCAVGDGAGARPPAPWRINQLMADQPGFARAFNCAQAR